jgi:integrase/recombinase XerD
MTMQLHYALDGYWLSKRRNLSVHTVADYTVTFRRLVEFLGPDREFEEITSADLNRFMDHVHELGISDKTLRNHWTALSSLWTWAESEYDIKHILRNRVARPRYRRKPIDPFTQDEIRALLKHLNEMHAWDNANRRHVTVERPTALRDRAILLVLLDCGLRATELSDLLISDYDQKRGMLTIRHGKGDKARHVHIAQGARQAVWAYLKERKETAVDQPLFVTRTGAVIDRFALRNLIMRAGQRAGVEHAYPHRFRHTFAVNFLRNGGSPLELQDILGHEDLSTIKIYVRLAQVDIEKAQQKASPVDKWKL